MSSEAKNVVLVAPATAVAHAAAAAPVTVTAEAVCANNNKNNNKKEWTDVQFKTVVFPSQPQRSFRVTVQRHEEVTLVAEDNQTHDKWASVIEHPAKHGPDMPMPMEAFIAALETSIKQLNKAEPTARVASADIAEKANSSAAAHAASAEASRTGVSSDMVPVADAMNLTLRMQLSVFWEPEYTFNLTQIGLKTVDLLVAQVRDLQEELYVYKEKERLRLASRVHLVCNENKKANGGFLQWMCSTPIDERAFTLTGDSTTIVISNDGLYHIEALISCVYRKDSTSGNRVTLHVNKSRQGGSVATPESYHSFTILSRTTYLKAGDQLGISAENIASPYKEQSSFTISLIA